MKTLTATLLCACLSIAAGSAAAADHVKKDGMTMQECKDHMAMAKKDGMKRDDAMMKKDTVCADMMKKDGIMKKDDGMMKKDTMKK